MNVSMSFLADLPIYESEKPYDLYVPVPSGHKTSNCEYTEHSDIDLHDVEELGDQPDLATTGFKYVLAPSKVALKSHELEDGSKAAHVIQPYLSETVAVVKQEVGADRIICFDWRLRRRDTPKHEPVETPHDLDYDRFRAIEIAKVVHSDYSFNGGKARLHRQLYDEEVEQYFREGWRIQFINVWRPLVSIVEDAPLALCDRRSLKKEDLVLVDKIHPGYWEEGLCIKNKPYHQWFWKPKMTHDEVILFLSWDSHENQDELVACPPHVAFENPRAPKGCPRRESVEVRLIAFYKPAPPWTSSAIRQYNRSSNGS